MPFEEDQPRDDHGMWTSGGGGGGGGSMNSLIHNQSAINKAAFLANGQGEINPASVFAHPVNENVNEAIPEPSHVEMVPTSSLVSTQEILSLPTLEHAIANPGDHPIEGFKDVFSGQMFVNDGNHGAAAAILTGVQSVPVTVTSFFASPPPPPG